MKPRLVLVTGSGRSGTSSVAGTLKRLGLHVPQPEVPADDKNPRGYYEPLWVTEFHKRVLNPVPVRTIDTRPDAAAVADAAITPEVEAELRAWLADQLDEPQVLVKDPRAFWILPAWTRVAGELGAEVCTLTMLRHPTEVVRSRDSAYLTEQTPTFRRQRETANVAAWVNAAFATEAATRAAGPLVRAVRRPARRLARRDGPGRRAARAVVRARARRVAAPGRRLHRRPAQPLGHHLGRHRRPAGLRDLAERTWEAMNVLVCSPSDAGAISELAGLQEEYGELFDYSEAIAMDATTARVAAGRRDVRRKKDAQLDELRAELDAARAELAELRSRPTGLAGLFRR